MRNVEPRESEKYQSLEVLFEPFIQLPFDDLPDEIKSQWELAEMTHSWDSITPNQRRGLAKDHDSIYDPARRVGLIAGELIDEMNADAWWLMESVLPLHAAMLLSGWNPNTLTVADADRYSNAEMEPQDFRRLRNMFEAASNGVARTLKDWTEYARQRGQTIHSWIGKWEAWVSEVDAKNADTVAPVTETEAAVAPSDESVMGEASELKQWKMKIQIEAFDRMERLRAAGASPTVFSMVKLIAAWCRENNVKTDSGIYPSANYLRTHVLGGKHWTPPR